jgi:hypothetical protein
MAAALSALRFIDFRVAAVLAGADLRLPLSGSCRGSSFRASAAFWSTRQDRIAQDLDEAMSLKEEADNAIAAYEQELAERQGKANAIGNKARDAAKAAAEAERQFRRKNSPSWPRPKRASRRSATRPWPMSAPLPKTTADRLVKQLIGGTVTKAEISGKALGVGQVSRENDH